MTAPAAPHPPGVGEASAYVAVDDGSAAPVGNSSGAQFGARPELDPSADETPAAPALPLDTTPTWEIELLVSGIVLFALMQVPGWLHGIWSRRAPHMSLVAAAGGGAVLLALDAALFALIGCFLLHLGLRGYWVALVGANSVFPEGVRWDRQREYGPIQAGIIQRRVRPLPAFIARADNAASLVFATGFVLAASAVSSLAVVLGLAVLVWVLSTVVPLIVALSVFFGIACLFSIVVMGAALVDMRRGARLPPEGRTARTVRAILKSLSGLTPDGVRSLTAVLTSNLDKRLVYGVGLVGLGGAYVAANFAISDDKLPGASTYTYFAEDARPGVITAANYESLAASGGVGALATPSIQSEVVTDPYVQLFVPYRPSRHDPALVRVCPGLRPPPSDPSALATPASSAAVLACADRLHAVTLDGRPVTNAHFRFFTNPRTERRGFQMLIPAAALAPGEHVLAVQPARRQPSPADTVPIRIPFWR